MDNLFNWEIGTLGNGTVIGECWFAGGQKARYQVRKEDGTIWGMLNDKVSEISQTCPFMLNDDFANVEEFQDVIVTSYPECFTPQFEPQRLEVIREKYFNRYVKDKY
jgi:hypothetical protein